MPPSLRSNSERGDEVINFLKSSEFEDILKSAVSNEVSVLTQTINELRNEVQVLKETNIDLIRLLTNKSQDINLNTVVCDNIKFRNQVLSQNTYAEIAKVTQKPEVTRKSEITKKLDATQKPESLNIHIKPTTPTNTSSKDNNAGQWQTVTRKNSKSSKRLNSIYGTGKDTTIKGAMKYSHFHVSGLEPAVTQEDVINYLKGKNIDSVKCEKLNSKRPDEYASYKLSVPVQYKEQIKTPDTWPLNVRVNPFLFRLAQSAATGK